MKVGEIWRRKNDDILVEIIEIIYTDADSDDLECLEDSINAVVMNKNLKEDKRNYLLDSLSKPEIVDIIYKDYFVKFVICKTENEMTVPRRVFLKMFTKEE